VYQKLTEVFDEDFVFSLMQDNSRTIHEFGSYVFPDFIQKTTLPENRNLSSLEKEYAKCYIYGRLNHSSIQLKHLPDLIHLSLFLEDLNFFVQTITKCKDIFVGKLENAKFLTILAQLGSIFDKLQKLEPLYPEYGLQQGLRMFLEGIKDRCDALLLNVEENCYEYNTIRKNGVCYCGRVCLAIESALSSNYSSMELNIDNEYLNHVKQEFQNNIPLYRLMMEKPLNEVIEITTTPRRNGKVNLKITKKPVVPYDIQGFPYILQKVEELLVKLPSYAKSARKRHLPVSNEEPPLKIQKQQ